MRLLSSDLAVMSSLPPLGPAGAGPRASATEAQWELHKNRIGELYVTEGRTADEVRGIMIADHGFDVTKRMYKQRFKTWGMARKNLKAIEYEAMKMVYDEILAREGVEVQFSAVRGIDIKTHRISDVRKELARPGSKKRSDQNREEILARGLNQILERKEIRIIRPEQNALPGSEGSSTPSMGSCSMSLESDSDQDPFAEDDYAAMTSSSFEPMTLPCRSFQNSAQPLGLEIEADIDLIAFGLMSIEYSEWSEGPWSDSKNQSEATRDAHNWARHLFETCIRTDEMRTDSAAGRHRNSARNVFTRMLLTGNQHILSSMVHISCVFAGIGGVDTYRSILRDCRDVINSNHGRSLSYAVPYLYALACEEHEGPDIINFGNLLHEGIDPDGYDSQTLSSNFLVRQQYRAYHLLEYMQDAEGARAILVRCLHESSRCLERDHSVNVNCLYILARAYERLGNLHAAVDTYFEAAERSRAVFGARHPYRMILVRGMALLQARLGMETEAEQNLIDVFWNRTALLGPGHTFTYSSGEELQDFLISHGRHDHAAQLRETRRIQYRDDKYWTKLSERDAVDIRRQRRNNAGLHWEKEGEGLFKYAFVMPKEAYMRESPASISPVRRSFFANVS
jgi:hypothetical protein